MGSITQDMRRRQSLMEYALKHGVAQTCWKVDKSRSHLNFWLKRHDGTLASLCPQSRRSEHHPYQHTADESKPITDMRRRNPDLGFIKLWHHLRMRRNTRRPESLCRVMRRMGMFRKAKLKKKCVAKPCEQITRAGERVQADVKAVPRRCIADPTLRLYRYTAIDEYSRLRYLGAYLEQSTWSSADFVRKAIARYGRQGIRIECLQTDNGFEFTNRFSASRRDLPTRL